MAPPPTQLESTNPTRTDTELRVVDVVRQTDTQTDTLTLVKWMIKTKTKENADRGPLQTDTERTKDKTARRTYRHQAIIYRQTDRIDRQPERLEIQTVRKLHRQTKKID